MAREHFFSWPRSVEGLDRRTLFRVGLRMVAAAPVWVIGLAVVAAMLGAVGGPLAGVSVALNVTGLLVGAAYLLRGAWLLLRSLPGGDRPWVAAVSVAAAPGTVASAPAAAPGQVEAVRAPVQGRGSGGAVWVFVVIALLAGLVWFNAEFDKYGKRARLSEGPLAASSLLHRMRELYGQAGPRDMSCSAAHCALGEVELRRGSGVRQVSSDRTGLITIEYDFGFLPQDRRVLTLAPTVEGRVVDLSLPRAEPIDPAALAWKCLDAKTTVPREWLRGGRCD